ncbi:MAG: hypothetical protein U0R50_10105 [Gaiellales bacterium]
MTPEQEAQSFRDGIGPMLSAAVAQMSEHIDDPTEFELAASSLLPAELGDLPDHIVATALEIIEEAPGGPRALAALAVSGPSSIGAAARTRLETTGDDGSPRGLQIVEAYELDNDEPVIAVHLICTREGVEGRQLFAFVVDIDETAGALKDGFAVPASTGEDAIVGFHAEAARNGLELGRIDPDLALERIAQAARRGAEVGVAPDRDGLTAVAILLRTTGVPDADAILAGLEDGDLLEGYPDPLDDEIAEALERNSDIAFGWFRAKGYDDHELDDVLRVVELMGEFRLRYLDAEISDWKRAELDGFLLDWVPRSEKLNEREVERFVANVGAVLEFLAGTGDLSPRTAKTLAKRAVGHADRFRHLAATATVGHATLIARAMEEDGVDFNDPAAVQRWMDAFNERPFAERDALFGASLPPSTHPDTP